MRDISKNLALMLEIPPIFRFKDPDGSGEYAPGHRYNSFKEAEEYRDWLIAYLNGRYAIGNKGHWNKEDYPIEETYPDFKEFENFVNIMEIFTKSNYEITVTMNGDGQFRTHLYCYDNDSQYEMWNKTLISSVLTTIDYAINYENDPMPITDELKKEAKQVKWNL